MMIYEYFLLKDDMGLEEVVELACRNREIPGAVLVAHGPDNFQYAKAFGTTSLKKGAANTPLRTDALLWTASCTKLQTTIACLQCVEKGLMTLDEDITRLLTEFKDVEILTGFDPVSKAPILEKNTTKLTLRHLLTHASGISYDHFSPTLMKYLKYHNKKPSNGRTGKIAEKYFYPLLFAPGTSFEYGAGIDWAGQALERCTSQTLSQYLSEHVWKPLKMKSCTFDPQREKEKYDKVMAMAMRDGLVHPQFGTTMSPDAECIESEVKHPRDVAVSDDYGGAGIFCSMPDLALLLKSICQDDGKILSSKSIDLMFSPQLSMGSKERLAKILSFPEVNNSMGGLPSLPEVKEEEGRLGGKDMVDWGLGGQMTPVNVEGRRKKGSIYWGGLPNLFWWIDRESGVSGVFGTQLMPTGDPKCVELMARFEKAVYEAVELQRRGKERGRL